MGGSDGRYDAFHDTWTWNGASWSSDDPLYPPRQGGRTITFDSNRNVTVMFSSNHSSENPFANTWEWDGTIWSMRATTGPPQTFGEAMTFDSHRNVVVLFTGSYESVGGRQTWEWDGSSWA